MRFVTKTRLDHLTTLIRSMGDEDIHKQALHLIESIKWDIEENYAEIKKPIRYNGKN